MTDFPMLFMVTWLLGPLTFLGWSLVTVAVIACKVSRQTSHPYGLHNSCISIDINELFWGKI